MDDFKIEIRNVSGPVNAVISSKPVLLEGTLLDSFTVLNFLKNDKFFDYYLLVDGDEIEFISKMVRNGNKTSIEILNYEIEILNNVEDEEITGMWQEGSNPDLNIDRYIIREFHPDLNETICDGDLFCNIISSIFEGMKYLHSINMLYVDFSPSNFYWDGEKVLFSNFSSAQLCEDSLEGNVRKEKEGNDNFLATSFQLNYKATKNGDLESFIYLIMYLSYDMFEAERTLPWYEKGNIGKITVKKIVREKTNFDYKRFNELAKIDEIIAIAKSNDEYDDNEVEFLLENICSNDIPEAEDILTRSNIETDIQFEFRKKVYDIISSFEDYEHLNVNNLTLCLMNRCWYGVTYDEHIEIILDEIQELL